MSGLGPLVATVVLVAACVGASAAHLRAVSRRPSGALAALVPRLGRLDLATRLGTAVSATEAATWEGRLARSLSEAATELDRTDAASEAVHDLGAGYAKVGRWSWAALRVQLLGGVLIASWAMIAEAPAAAAIVLLASFAGGVVIAQIGRRAADVEARQRRLSDAYLDALLGGSAAPASSRPPGGRGRGWRPESKIS